MRRLRARPDVDDVLVGITEDMGDDAWPFADTVFVLTHRADPAAIMAEVATLQPTSVELVAGDPPAFVIWWDDILGCRGNRRSLHKGAAR